MHICDKRSSEMSRRAVVIGAGVVGLAIARELALAGHKVIVVEAASIAGTETSSKNSEIIHGGLYYEPGSLKAKLCVQGRHMLYDYCATHGVKTKRLGKLLVATSDQQIEALREIKATATSNGVHDLRWLSVPEAKKLEPSVHCVAALLSPSTGVVDGQELMRSLQVESMAHGAEYIFDTSVIGGSMRGSVKILRLQHAATGDQRTLQAEIVVNAAGLWAQHLSQSFEGVPASSIPKLYLARGCYFELIGKSPFSRQVYPIPTEAGLGTHATLDVRGTVKFGPDSEWMEWDPSESPSDYSVDPGRAELFYSEIRKYWPDLKDGQLRPAFSGIRPKLSGPGDPKADFVIQGPADHLVAGLVNLYGIESPGLTSCLAIAGMVLQLLTPT